MSFGIGAVGGESLCIIRFFRFPFSRCSRCLVRSTGLFCGVLVGVGEGGLSFSGCVSS